MTRRSLAAPASAALVTAMVVGFALATNRNGADAREPDTHAPHDARFVEPRSGSVEATTLGTAPARPKVQTERPFSKRDLADEATIMAELRTLAQSSPEKSLELAREGDARFPGSEDAPERAWFKIRSLVNLGRFEEARVEAVLMVDTFRDTPWAGDVERHLLTHPLNHPSHRGNLPD